MSLKSGQSLTVNFTVQDATGAAADADSPPSGTLLVNGVADDATVTVTNISTGLYRAAVTLPTLNAGDVVAMLIEASVDAVSAKGIVFQAVADTQCASDVKAVVDAIKAVTDLLPNGGALTDLALEATAQSIKGKTDNLPASPAAVGSAMTLADNAITAPKLADSAVAKIEAALLNEGDGQALIDAIVQAIDAADISTNLTVAMIRDGILNRVLAGNHDTAGTVGLLLQNLDAAISSVGGAAGSGADTVTLTIQDVNGNPIADAAVWITSDIDGSTLIAGTLRTNDAGKVKFLLDAGTTYYLWARKAGVLDVRAKAFTATAD